MLSDWQMTTKEPDGVDLLSSGGYYGNMSCLFDLRHVSRSPVCTTIETVDLVVLLKTIIHMNIW